ncbi:MAG: hypothetical protein KAJ51_04870 [Thermoplasmata archaeon]|nr:hypothetical protein [Thermoplasmata archaeon]
MSKSSSEDIECKKYRPKHEYTHAQEFIDNLPYIVMTIVGGIILIFGFEFSSWGWVFGGLYLSYSVIGAFWIIIFVCPYCQYYATRACPCGYGQIAVKLRPKSDENRFKEKFNKHIPIIVPLWIIPLIAGVIFIIINFTLLMLFLIIIFGINSFVILPLLSRKYGCAHCPQKDDCPWMGKNPLIS